MPRIRARAFGFISLLFSATALSISLAGCGGEDFGPAILPAPVYSGPTWSAAIKSGNAVALLTSAWNSAIGTTNAIGNGKPNATTGGDLTTLSVIRTVVDDVENTLSGTGRGKVQITTPLTGAISGTLYRNMDIDAGTGTIDYIYSNYDNGGTAAFNGQVLVTVTGFDEPSMVLTGGDITFNMLEVAGTREHLLLHGGATISSSVATHLETLTLNLSARDFVDARYFKLENLIWQGQFDNLTQADPCLTSFSINGRIYLAPHGYVDAISPALTYTTSDCDSPYPAAGGPLMLTGYADSAAVLIPVSDSRAHINVDEDGDGFLYSYEAPDWVAYAREAAIPDLDSNGLIVTAGDELSQEISWWAF